MKAFFESIDLYSYKINFNYKNKNVFHSYFGFSLSLIMYSLCISLVWYFAQDFIYDLNPQVIYKEVELTSKENTTLDKIFTSLRFEFSIILDDTEYLEKAKQSNTGKFNFSDHFTVNLLQIEDLNATSDIFLELEFKNFQLGLQTGIGKNKTLFHYFLEIDEATIFKYKVKHFSPVQRNPQLKENLLVEVNEITNKNFSQLKFGINKRTNVILSIQSSNLSYIFDIFRYEVILKDYLIDVNNPDFFKPYNFQYTKSYINLKPNTLLDTAVFDYRVSEVINNRGIIFKEITRSTSIQKNYIYNTQDIYDFDYKDPFDFFKIEMTQIKKLYERNYKKLQNIFADLGGILNSLILIGNIIVFQFNKRKFDCDVINFLIRAEKPKERNEFFKNLDLSRNLEYKKGEVNTADYLDKGRNLNNRELKIYSDINNKEKKKYEDLNNLFRDNIGDNSSRNLINQNLKPVNDINNNKDNTIDFKEDNTTNNINNKDKNILNSQLKENNENLSSDRLKSQNKNENSYINSINDPNISKFGDARNDASNKDNIVNYTNCIDIHNKDKITNLNNKNNSINFYQNNLKALNQTSLAKDFKSRKNLNFNVNNFNKECLENSGKEMLRIKVKDYFNKIKKDNHLRFDKFLKFSAKEFLLTSICCAKVKSHDLLHKEKIFDKVQSKIYEYLDILTYMKSLEDWEKLKYIFFNPSQIVAFDFSRTRCFEEITKKNYEDEIIKSIEYYSKSIDEYDLYDLKLRNLFSDEYENMLKNSFE